MALKKLEERTKSLDFGQGHTGRKRHHNNLSSLLEFSDNVGALVKGRSQSILHSEGLAFLIDFFLNGFGLVGLGGLQVVVAQQIDTIQCLACSGPAHQYIFLVGLARPNISSF